MSRTIRHPKQKRLQRAFSLIEVLVAIVVLSLGLLGLAALQMTSLRFNQSAYQRTQATTLAQDIFDCIRANKTNASSYAIAAAAAAPTGSTTAAIDVFNWRSRITAVLGAGAQGSVEGPEAGTGKFIVRIIWNDATDASNNVQSGRGSQTFTYTAVP